MKKYKVTISASWLSYFTGTFTGWTEGEAIKKAKKTYAHELETGEDDVIIHHVIKIQGYLS